MCACADFRRTGEYRIAVAFVLYGLSVNVSWPNVHYGRAKFPSHWLCMQFSLCCHVGYPPTTSSCGSIACSPSPHSDAANVPCIQIVNALQVRHTNESFEIVLWHRSTHAWARTHCSVSCCECRTTVALGTTRKKCRRKRYKATDTLQRKHFGRKWCWETRIIIAAPC